MRNGGRTADETLVSRALIVRLVRHLILSLALCDSRLTPGSFFSCLFFATCFFDVFPATSMGNGYLSFSSARIP
jgi:hypothetical protein